jgi:hypothetical protein
MDSSVPKQSRIDFVNNLYKQGAHVIIYSARFPEMYQETFSWLIRYGVLFHGICLGRKPGADLYLDDKALHSSEMD